MIAETHEQLGRPARNKVSRLVVYDNFGNAIATFLQIDDKNIDARFRGQPGFEEALRFLGIRQTVVCDVVNVKDLPVIRVD